MPIEALSLDHDAVAGLMRLWSRIHWSAGDGMMPPEQMLAIYGLAVDWPVKGDVVELGSWVGLTTCYLATACRVRNDGHVYAVDTFKGTREGGTSYASTGRYDGDTLDAFERRILTANMGDLVKPLVGWTTDIAEVYPGRPIRVLLIDADHSYDGVRRDYERWFPHVAPGGLIIFHDYLMPDVARFVDEVVQQHSEISAAPGCIEANVYAVTKRITATPSQRPFRPQPQRPERREVAARDAGLESAA